MKHFFLFLLLTTLLLISGNTVFSQIARWRQMNDFPSGGRAGAFSFKIENKIYIGCGSADGIVKNDFWEYDISTNKWTRKADFGGGKRVFAIAFSIGAKGYAGTGSVDEEGNTIVKDFWEYNPATNKWTRKADFGGGKRFQAFGAATSTRGYAGTGLSGKEVTSVKRDVWEYNPTTNTWRSRAGLGFIPRFGATAFAMNGKIYAGTGVNNFAQAVKDFYEYNPNTNRWRRRASYGGTGVYRAVGFSIGSVGYIGTGIDQNQKYHADFWSYDVGKNAWAKVPNLPGAARTGATAVSSNNSGFVLTGFNEKSLTDVWNLEQVPVSTVTSAGQNEKIAAEQVAIAPIRIAPNPATTRFTLSVNKGDDIAPTVILIYNLQGMLVKKYDLGNINGNFTKTIDVSSLAAGMYKVVVERGALRETTSLLIAR